MHRTGVGFRRRIAASLIASALALSLTSCQPTTKAVTSATTATPKAGASTPAMAASPVVGPRGSVLPLAPRAGAAAGGRVTLFSNFDPSDPFATPFAVSNWVNPKFDQAFFDFDAGTVANSSGSDVYLVVSCGTACFSFFVAINGATVNRAAFTEEPGLAGCRKELRDSAKNGLSPGQGLGYYSCVMTNAGNVVQLHVDSVEPRRKDFKLVFDYELWHLSQTP